MDKSRQCRHRGRRSFEPNFLKVATARYEISKSTRRQEIDLHETLHNDLIMVFQRYTFIDYSVDNDGRRTYQLGLFIGFIFFF